MDFLDPGILLKGYRPAELVISIRGTQETEISNEGILNDWINQCYRAGVSNIWPVDQIWPLKQRALPVSVSVLWLESKRLC